MTLYHDESIRDHLAAAIDQVPVELYPENPLDYDLQHQHGAVLVMYTGARPGEVDSGVQVEEQRYRVVILARGLRDGLGAHALMEACRGALRGHSPDGLARLRLLDERLVGHHEGVWRWEQDWGLRVVSATAAGDDGYL